VTALKEELFAVETDKLQGRLSETEYAEQKSALETCVAAGASAAREREIDASNVYSQLYEGLTDEYVQIDTAAGYANAVPDFIGDRFGGAMAWCWRLHCRAFQFRNLFLLDKLALRM